MRTEPDPPHAAWHGSRRAWPGTLGLTARPASAQTAVSLQLSWLHSSQFAGSYIALDRGWWSEAASTCRS